jgi:flagellin
MSISLQTNVTSLVAQQNLNVNTTNESNTIEQLTSGYRINSSGDDAAGLAVANQYQADIGQLTQGVQNANNGVSTLQIIDGGLSNISQILNRLETLATESASGTFTGNRTTLNNEYQQQLTEISRQAANIGLNSGGDFNKALSVYIGGGELSTQLGTSQVNVDLSGTANAVDATSLGLTGTDVLGGTTGGVALTGNAVRLDNPATLFLAAGTQTYTFNYSSGGTAQSRSVVLSGGASGINGTTAISQLNAGLTGTGITASINATTGLVNFTSSDAFTVGTAAATAGTSTTTGADNAVNTSQYNVQTTAGAYAGGPPVVLTGNDTFTLSNGTHSANVSLATGDTVATDVNTINATLAAAGITNVSALANGAGTGISFQGSVNFSLVDTTNAAGGASPLFGAAAAGNVAVTAATGGGTAGTDATAAIAAISSAVQALGLVQGKVGTGENQLNFAINLANSQISSFSNAESSIKDVDVAAAASNLSKEQILQQSSVAALVQANAIPQAVLSLLKSA